MSTSETRTETAAVEADVLLAALPAFALLPDGVRGLVAESFELLDLPFGAVIVREGEEADAFFVLASGSARVVKETAQGEEVALNVLQRGDAFGEAGLLDQTTRTATVRTSSAAQVLRLHSSVFAALARSHPEVRTAFEAMARTRELSDFFRIHAGFATLPNKALAQLITGLEEVEVAAGELVVREGDPPGPMFVVEEGRLRTFRMQDGAQQDLAYLRKGDFFGERSLFRGEPRNASVEALIDCRLLRLPPALYASLLDEHPEFRARMEERILQYSYERLARVPLDFADEILPAEIAAAERDLGEPEALTPEPEEAEELGDESEAAQGKRPGRRFPHVTQLDEMDCGAACLAMICRFFGRAVPISYIRDVAHTSTRGTSLNGITRGAGELGLVARSIRASKSRLDELPLPAVVHWQGDHWVVLYRVGKKKVRIADPESSLRRLPREEFLKNWTGYASVIAYGEGLEQMPAARFSLNWLKPFLRPHYKMVAFATALAALAAVLQLVLPILTQQIVDNVLPHRDEHLLLIVMAAIIAVLLAMTGAGLVQQYLLSRVAVRLDVATLDHLTKTLFNLPMSYFATRRTGDIERRLAGAQQVRAFLTGSFIAALTSILQLIAALTLMFIYSWVLALVYLATVPIYAGLMRFSSQRLRPLYDDLEASFGRYSSGQIDAIRGIETVKALAAEDSLRLLMLARFQALAKRIFRTQFIVLGYHGALQMVGLLSFGLFLGVGALQVIHGSLTLGQFMAYNALIALANGPVLGLLSLWDGFQQTKVLLMRLDDVIEQEPEQGHDRSHLRAVGTLEGRVELQGVGFRYGGSGPILEDITFKVEPGETIAIVGRSGSGKTTLIKLLAGLLEPTEGTISYDGFDMRTLDYRTLRRQIGFVLQENYLFNDSIAGQHRLRRRDSRTGQVDRRRKSRERARVRAAATARLRHQDRRIRPSSLRRPAAASRDRPRPLPPAADPALRRGDKRARHRVRAGGQAEPRRAPRRPYLVRDRAPAEHDPRRRSHPRARTRPHRRAGNP